MGNPHATFFGFGGVVNRLCLTFCLAEQPGHLGRLLDTLIQNKDHVWYEARREPLGELALHETRCRFEPVQRQLRDSGQFPAFFVPLGAFAPRQYRFQEHLVFSF